jgi:hypothetical protein
MTASGEDEDDAFLFRPVWETEDELDPPGLGLTRLGGRLLGLGSYGSVVIFWVCSCS